VSSLETAVASGWSGGCGGWDAVGHGGATACEVPPVARIPDLRWPRPPGRVSPWRLFILLSSVVVLLSWLVSGLNRSLQVAKDLRVSPVVSAELVGAG
jgi:hypothetical protein